MDTLIVSPESKIKSYKNYKIVYTVKCEDILSYEAYHADMQVCKVSDTLIVPPNLFDYYKNQLSGKNIIKGKSVPKGAYPSSVSYNVAVVNNFAICNKKYTDEVILECLENNNIEIINVKQGYAKCSVGVFGDKIVTSDEGIYKACMDKISTLLISKGNISLPGCEYGFIGGASGFDGVPVFLGSLSNHPDCHKIKAFLGEVCEIDGELLDVGSLIFI